MIVLECWKFADGKRNGMHDWFRKWIKTINLDSYPVGQRAEFLKSHLAPYHAKWHRISPIRPTIVFESEECMIQFLLTYS